MRSSWRHSRKTAWNSIRAFNQQPCKACWQTRIGIFHKLCTTTSTRQCRIPSTKKALWTAHASSEWNPSILLNHVLLFISVCFPSFEKDLFYPSFSTSYSIGIYFQALENIFPFRFFFCFLYPLLQKLFSSREFKLTCNWICPIKLPPLFSPMP